MTGRAIKIKLLELGRTQLDLLEELKKYGYHLKPQLLSSYITGYKRTPQCAVVLDLVGNILKEWEGANENAEVH